MNIIVESFTGRRMIFDVDLCDTICSLKQQISDKEGININVQGLVHLGKPLANETIFSECNV